MAFLLQKWLIYYNESYVCVSNHNIIVFLKTQMKAAGIDVMDELIKIKFVPKAEDLDFKDIVDKLIEKMK